LTDLGQRINTLAYWIYKATYFVALTGTGISTASGLPGFRDPDGICTPQAKELITKPPDSSSATPNAGHMAIVELQKLGKLTFPISQNVDNLHIRSGIRSDLVAELEHGALGSDGNSGHQTIHVASIPAYNLLSIGVQN